MDIFIFNERQLIGDHMGSAPHPQWDDTMEHACRSFLELTKVGTDYVIAQNGFGRDTLLLSIAYTWRHYVELRLKLFVVAYDYLKNRPRRELKDHGLAKWWTIARATIIEIFPGEDHTTHLPPVDAHIADLDRLDPGAVSFRYTLKKDGSSALPPGLVGISWEAFAEARREVSLTLEGAAGMFAKAVQHKLDTRE